MGILILSFGTESEGSVMVQSVKYERGPNLLPTCCCLAKFSDCLAPVPLLGCSICQTPSISKVKSILPREKCSRKTKFINRFIINSRLWMVMSKVGTKRGYPYSCETQKRTGPVYPIGLWCLPLTCGAVINVHLVSACSSTCTPGSRTLDLRSSNKGPKFQ